MGTGTSQLDWSGGKDPWFKYLEFVHLRWGRKKGLVKGHKSSNKVTPMLSTDGSEKLIHLPSPYAPTEQTRF